jgi:hypothetical protein
VANVSHRTIAGADDYNYLTTTRAEPSALDDNTVAFPAPMSSEDQVLLAGRPAITR